MKEWLEAEKIKSAISPQNQSLLSQIQILPSIASTNTFLLSHCREYPNGFVLFAEEQTAGRGRQGKVWVSPQSGNIYASILWHVPTRQQLAPLSLAVAVMLVEALEKFGVAQGLQLKWPNDIYYAGKKLAGILIESVALSDAMHAVVIGFGLNVVDDELGKENAISLADIKKHGGPRNALAGLLVDALITGLTRYSADGFTEFLTMWERYDMLRGKSVVLHTTGFSIPGVALGVNTKGELLIRDEFGKELTFNTGEVSVMLS